MSIGIGPSHDVATTSLANTPAPNITPERALDAITAADRPSGYGLAQWSSLSSVEQLQASIGAEADPLLLARAELVGDGILIAPEGKLRSDLPSFTIPNDNPNNLRAGGFSPGFTTHDYLVTAIAPSSVNGQAGLAAVETALILNPTPGRDQPASPNGTRNDVGNIPLSADNDTNIVRSFLLQSSDPNRSAAVINYTVGTEHVLEEGFVMRFAELRPDGRVELVTYGEGNALPQMEKFGLGIVTRELVTSAWAANAEEVFRAATHR